MVGRPCVKILPQNLFVKIINYAVGKLSFFFHNIVYSSFMLNLFLLFLFQSGVTPCLPGWKHDFDLTEVIGPGEA